MDKETITYLLLGIGVGFLYGYMKKTKLNTRIVKDNITNGVDKKNGIEKVSNFMSQEVWNSYPLMKI